MNSDLQACQNSYYHAVNRRQFLKMVGETSVVAGAYLAGWRKAVASPGTPLFPELEDVGEKYSFAVIADPQVNRADFPHAIYQTTQRKLSMIVDEINEMSSMPAFVLFNGDLVSQVGVRKRGPEQIENFISRVVPLKPTTILVHGNHDGHEPWTEFKQMQKAVNGTEVVWFSWDVGRWHFIGIPAYLDDTQESEKAFFEWLARDLELNRARPTMAFVHWHLMPGFRTQHQWYTFEKPVRIKVIEELTKHGNVQYVFSGHIHNGIMVTARSAWEYKGTKFIVVPTCIAPKSFGAEFPEFAEGLGEAPQEGDTGGGYYIMVDVDGEDATVKCRLVDNDNEYVLGDYKPYKNNEPLWFKDVTDLDVHPKLVNGSFESGLEGWLSTCRFVSDKDPGYMVETSPNPGGEGTGAIVQVREQGQRWASGAEIMEVYQMVSMPSSGALFEASYYMETMPKHGGGFIRLSLYSGTELKFIMTFDWGSEEDAVAFNQHAMWVTTGQKWKDRSEYKNSRTWAWKTPMTPNKWHELRVDIGTVYDVMVNGASSALGIDRLLVSVGAWSGGSEPGMMSRVRFDDLTLLVTEKIADSGILFDGKPL